jgi:hypothetical protein
MAENIAETFLKFQSPGSEQKLAIEDPDTMASAAGLQAAPKAYLTTVSGTNAMTLIPIPWPSFAGTIAYQPTGAFTGATGGTATATNKPIGLAFTAVVGKTLFLTYSPKAGLWYPSYTS